VNKFVIVGVALFFVGVGFLVSGDMGYYEHFYAMDRLDASNHCSRYVTTEGCVQPPDYIPPIPYDQIEIGIALVLSGSVLAITSWLKPSVMRRIVKG